MAVSYFVFPLSVPLITHHHPHQPHRSSTRWCLEHATTLQPENEFFLFLNYFTCIVSAIVNSAESCIRETVATTLATLAEVTAGVPYYKFNGLWTRQVQDLVCFCFVFF